MGAYVDGFVIPVPKNKLKEYLRFAQIGKKVWKKHGALEYFECVGDDLNQTFSGITFPQTVKAKKNEIIIFSFIVYKSRAHRDKVNKKVMQDPLMDTQQNIPMPFDMKRMAYGGFKTIVKG